MSKKNIAWCAGLFEGEGCVYVHYRERGYQRAYAVINMTDEDVIKDFHKTIGIGHIWGPYGDYRKKKDGGPRLPQWRWYSTGEKALKFIDLIYPYMGKRRKKKMDEIRKEMEKYALQKYKSKKVSLG